LAVTAEEPYAAVMVNQLGFPPAADVDNVNGALVSPLLTCIVAGALGAGVHGLGEFDE
jgi:hypothetical protein